MSKTKGSGKKSTVPRLRFPEFREAWQARRIGHYLSESKTKGSTGDIAKKLTVKLWGNGVYEKQETLSGSENTQYYRRKAGQFIYSKLDFLNQAFGIIPKHLDGYESTVDLPSFEVSSDLDARFLLEYVQRKDFYKKHGDMADGGRKAKRIQVETFLAFPIYLPQKEEQEKIADCLSSLDALITAQAEKLDALKAHKKGLMQRLFPREGETGPELRFPEFRNAGDWELNELSDIAELIREKAGNRKFTLMSITAGVGLVTQLEKFGREIAGAQYKNYFVIRQNDFAYNKSSTKGYPEGFIDMYCGEEPGAVPNSIFTCFRVDETTVIPIFLNHLFSANLHGKWLAKSLTVGARTHGTLNVDNRDLLALPVPIPRGASTFDEQRKIADCLTSLDALIAAQAEKLDAFKAHKKGLLQQLFPSPEAAEA